MERPVQQTVALPLTLRVAGSEMMVNTISRLVKIFFSQIAVRSTSDADETNGQMFGLMFTQLGQQPRERLQLLVRLGCAKIVVVKPSAVFGSWWQESDASVKAAFDDYCVECSPDLASIVSALHKCASIQTAAPASRSCSLPQTSRILRTLEAQNVYSLLGAFSHNSQFDIANQILAPLRLLLLCGSEEEARTVWQSTSKKFSGDFKKNVCETIGNDTLNHFGEIGREICRAYNDIEVWFTATTAKRVESDDDASRRVRPQIDNLDRLMSLMTEARVDAGISTRTTARIARRATVKPQALAFDQLKSYEYRILVVDDHAAAWQPVFGSVKEKAKEENINLLFDFATNASSPGFWASVPKYDLILLDVFLGTEKGTDVLQRLRLICGHIPVLLWTTSRDVEIAAEAVQANGVILKKTMMFESLVESITTWAKEGKSRRCYSLPNPTFDQIIRRADLREVAQKFNYWSLRQLDGFHALDSEVYRFFTDHGGRHIIRLMELMEDTLKPCLMDDTVFSLDPQEREIELFCLYLAILSHEFGMFPMNGDVDLTTLTASQRKKYQGVARALHPMRGMLLLGDDSTMKDGLGHWPDQQGRNLAHELDDLPLPEGWHSGFILKVVAVLTAYHSRFLEKLAPDSVGDGHFLKWQKSGDEKFPKWKADDLPENVRTNPLFQIDTYKQCLDKLQQSFKESTIWNRLPRWCAILRFVDALDLDQTRNPIKIFLSDRTRPAIQDRENLKRDVCVKVDVRDSSVRLQMSVPAPNVEWVSAILNENKDLQEVAEKFVGDPWSEGKADVDLKPFYRALDTELLKAWEIIRGTKHKSDYPTVASAIGFDKGNLQDTFDAIIALRLASITALVVALETRDEFQAIIETGLSEQIKLDKIIWSKTISVKQLVTLQIAKEQSTHIQ
jgi:CheY-like chemotaxis protein